MGIPEIFAQQGEEAFRELETAVLESLAGVERCVVATGGGIIVKRAQPRAPAASSASSSR